MNKLPLSIRISIKIFILVLLIFSTFRFIQFSLHYNDVISNNHTGFYEILKAFVIGIQYDLSITSYLLVLPFLFLILYDYLEIKLIKKIVFEFIFVVFTISFLISAVDIPYYNQFYSRLTVEALHWFSDPKTVFGMVFQEVKYWIIFIPLIAILWLFRKKLSQLFKTSNSFIPRRKHIPYYFLFLTFVFFGLRGKVTGAPLRHRDAFNGKDAFLNTLKLNPVFTLGKSYKEKLKNKELTLMNPKLAIQKVRTYKNITQTNLKSPIANKINYTDSLKNKKNVVLILMESMATAKMNYFGDTKKRTPFLDSLFLKGLSFSNIYSNGIHTYSGVFGTNYSFPMMFSKHPMTALPLKKYNGLPYTLKKHGYNTSFFIAGDGGFDNMSHFLLGNHYDSVYTRADYPKKEIVNVYGVSDDFLLNFALKKITEQSKESDNPFLASILTISDHGPFRFPDYYESDTKDKRIKATQYADWSLKRFMEKAKKQDWFDNTIFVFVADHGETMGINYRTPLTYNHIPVIYYYKGIKPTIINNIGSQMDVFPTLMGLLQLDYTNNSFGIDLLREKRSYALFNHDKEYGVIDNDFLLISNRNETLGLYKYQNKDKTNYADKYPTKLKEMEDYYKSNIQSYQYLIDNEFQFIE